MFGREALETQTRLLHGHLDRISTDGLSARLHMDATPRIPAQMRNELADAIVELSALIDEIRFSGAFAGLLIDDFERRSGSDSQNDAETGTEHQQVRDLGLPIAAMALLTPFLRDCPDPYTLFTTPHVHFAGDRVLSLWFAGQLIDSSLVRVVAALDRVAITLWSSAGLPIPISKRTPHPAFRPFYLKQLVGVYPVSELGPVLNLTEHPLYRFLISVRNGFTHSKRIMSELHGHYRVAYETADPRGIVTQAIDKQTHLAILLACYNEVLRPAIDCAKRCVTLDHKT